jgi:vancomycin resistance protein YoaR
MKKYIWAIIVGAILLILIAYFYFNKFNFSDKIDYNTQKLDTNIDVPKTTVTSVEKEISNFSTKIIDKDDNRDINMKITCEEINGTVIKVGEEFSFNKIAGNPTPDRGYKEAGIIVKGKLEKGYGGGNCQVSTTIYNAVKEIEGIEISERHEHGVELGYIEKGKDSTVVFDDLDLKFKNNTQNDIKLYATTTDTKVEIKVVKIVNEQTTL